MIQIDVWRWYLQAFLILIERIRLIERYPYLVTRLQTKIVTLYGSKGALERTKQFISRMIALAMAVFIFFGVVGLCLDHNLFWCVIALPPFVPFYQLKVLDQQIKRKKQNILMELPELINKLLLLINAGETVQQAIVRCVQSKLSVHESIKPSSPLYQELNKMVVELKNNRSFQLSMEDFNKRCQLQEVSIFTTTVLLNYHRGGSHLVLALRDLSRIVWDKRMSVAKIIGEEASSKLVFPMVFIFFIVLVIVAMPAIMMMGGN